MLNYILSFVLALILGLLHGQIAQYSIILWVITLPVLLYLAFKSVDFIEFLRK